MMNIAVIPARGGSKRIPMKNVKPFYGIPMIARAIEIAKKTMLFNQIVVSTDDESIAKLAQYYGAVTPFIRPSYLADDHSGTAEVVAHAISELTLNYPAIEYVCCIYPCVPLLMPQDLIRSYEMISNSDLDFVFPVIKYPHPIQRGFRLGLRGSVNFIFPEHEMTRTQDLEPTYHDAGQFYWGKAESWLSGKRMHSDGAGMLIPSWRVVDIDTPDDWHRAELLYRALCLESN